MEQYFVINGLPVDDQEVDENGAPLVDSVSRRVQDDLFAVARAGGSVKTQVEEVQSRKGQLQAYAGDNIDKLREVVLPLAESAGERAKLRNDTKADGLKARLDAAFSRVLEPTRAGEGSQGLSLGERRQAIASLLFATSRNEQDLNRTLATVGLSAYTQAVNNQASNLQNMIPVYDSAIAEDRAAFIVEYNAVIQQIIALAERVDDVQTSLDKQTELQNRHKAALVAAREREVKELQSAKANALKAAAAALAQQTRTEQETFAMQKAVTTTDQKNQELERQLNQLELGR
jgi:hypothetical protein